MTVNLKLRSQVSRPLEWDELDANFSQIAQVLNGLSTAMGTLPSDVATALSALETLQGTVGTMSGTVAALNSAAPTLAASVAAFELDRTVYALSGINIDPGNGGLQHKTITGATAFTVASGLAAGKVHCVTLELTNAGTNVTWPAAIKWAGGTAPTLTAAGVDIVELYTRDGGATWRGFLAAKDSK